MGETNEATDPFDVLPRLMRLSADSIYRLMHLGGRATLWREDSLTDVLRSHLAGAAYRIEATCPGCAQTLEPGCRWSDESSAPVRGGIRVTTGHEEHHTFGADLLMRIANPGSDREVRLLLQAKRVRLDKPLDGRSILRRNGQQAAKLVEAEGGFGADGYYLFYVQAPDAHQDLVRGLCKRHTAPQDCAAMLVPRQHVEDYMASGVRDAAGLLALGAPLVCFASTCMGRSKNESPAHRARGFAAAVGAPVPRFVRRTTPVPTRVPSVAVDAGTYQPPHSDRPRTSVPNQPGNVLLVNLGRWRSTPDEDRPGHGWRDGIDPEEMRESSRQWWTLARSRAKNINYLIAAAAGHVRGSYRVTTMITHTIDTRIGFEVETPTPGEEHMLRQIGQEYLDGRAPGTRNPVAYL